MEEKDIGKLLSGLMYKERIAESEFIIIMKLAHEATLVDKYAIAENITIERLCSTTDISRDLVERSIESLILKKIIERTRESNSYIFKILVEIQDDM